MPKKSALPFIAAVCLIALPYLLSLRPLIVLSGSMEPAIHTGSLIFIDIKKTDAKPGDIVTVDLSGGSLNTPLVTHRVVREEKGFLITKGDANEAEDIVRVDREQIVGTYVFQIPYLGFFIVFLRQIFSADNILYGNR